MSKKAAEVTITSMYKELDKLIRADSDTKQILKTCNKSKFCSIVKSVLIVNLKFFYKILKY